MGVKVKRKIIFGNYELWFDFVDVKVNYLIRSMFTMYIFFAISVGYIILVAMQMIIFYNNLRCFD